MNIKPDFLKNVLSNPLLATRSIEKMESERRLIDFIRNNWKALEPGQPFVPGWAVEATCDHLEAVTSGQIRRLLVNVPPGTTKSMSTSVFWPAWEWGPKQLSHHRFILAAHEQSLAIRDNVRSRDLMLDEEYQENWGESVTFKGDVNSKIYYENMKTGWRMASSVGSGLTGYRGDRLILDDPHSIKKADSDNYREEVLRWFSETLPTRLNKANESAIVIIMQRVHERDVSGLILAEELGYEHLMLPMEYEKERSCYSMVKPSYVVDPVKQPVSWSTDHKAWYPDPDGEILRYKTDIREVDGDLLWPERFNQESIDTLKKSLRAWGGGYAEAGQLQQRPAPRGGGMFQKDDWQYVDKAPMGGRVVRGWDLAATAAGTKNSKNAAYTVGVKLRYVENSIYIEDVDRRKAGPSAVEKMIKACALMDGVNCVQDFPQDPGQAGKAQKATLGKLLHGFAFQFSPETGSKEDRAKPFAAQVEIHNVFIVRGHWNSNFINEASLFPNGQFKDQVDAATRAYSAIIRKRRRLIGCAPTLLAAS